MMEVDHAKAQDFPDQSDAGATQPGAGSFLGGECEMLFERQRPGGRMCVVS
jgi:hypothetical protein